VYNSKEKMINASSEYYQFSLDTACMSGVYDMNGLKKPNQVGRDIGFFGVFYNGIESKSVATLPYKETINANWANADIYCRGIKGQKIPTIDELSALYLGRNITGIPAVGFLWSASSMPGNSISNRRLGLTSGGILWLSRNLSNGVRCVRD